MQFSHENAISPGENPQKHEISTAGCVGPILYHDPLGVVQHLHGWFGGLVGGGGEEVKGAAGGENGRFLREIHGVFLGSMDCFFMDNLQEIIVFTMKYRVILKFSLKPVH